MRRVPLALLIFLVFLAACSSIPEIRHDADLKGTPDREVCCRKDCLPFVEIPHRLIHIIEAKLPDGTVTSILGVVLVDPQADSLHCVLMTPEGFVLLDAVDNQGMAMQRGLPPFDSPAFAAGMLADIRLMLFPPQGPLKDRGRLENGAAICRYSDDEGKMTDVITGEADRREIRQYDASGFLQRVVRLSEAGQPGIYGKIELDAAGSGYSLQLTLLEAEPLR